jgi:hypothetical protein
MVTDLMDIITFTSFKKPTNLTNESKRGSETSVSIPLVGFTPLSLMHAYEISCRVRAH